MSKFVAIACQGVVQIHAAGGMGGMYASLCGLDGDDPAAEQAPAELPSSPRISCPQCRQLWLAWKRFRDDDFERTQKGPKQP